MIGFGLLYSTLLIALGFLIGYRTGRQVTRLELKRILYFVFGGKPANPSPESEKKK